MSIGFSRIRQMNLIARVQQEPPEQLWIRLPGLVTPTGSHKDKTVFKFIAQLATLQLNYEGALLLLQDSRAPVWPEEHIEALCNDPRSCALAVTHNDLRLDRTTVLCSNININESVGVCCGRELHVKLKKVPIDVLAQFFNGAVESVFNRALSSGPGGGADHNKFRARSTNEVSLHISDPVNNTGEPVISEPWTAALQDPSFEE